MIAASFWCAYTARGTSEYLPITRSWFAVELSQCLDKMADVNHVVNHRGSTNDDLIKNALFMSRLVTCSRDLYWHWINRTLLCDTMEVSMIRRAWLTIAQHVFLPALTGRPELISRQIVSSEPEQRLSRWADFANNCLPRIGSKVLPRFREKYRALGRQKWGPTWNRDIQSTPVILCLLGAKIRERELSGSPVISREGHHSRIQDHRPTLPGVYNSQNSMLSDNRGTYVSRISTHIDIAPATNHNKQH